MKIPSWQVDGIVSEVRALTSKTNTVWMHVVKVMAMGGIFELQTKDPAIAGSVGAGQPVTAVGSFEFFNGAARFVLKTIAPVK